MLGSNARRRNRTIVCALAVFLHLAFAGLAAMPQVVFCHRADGRVAVEFAGPAGLCLCDECEHCLERLAAETRGDLPQGPSLESCHCRHELALIEAARAAFLREKSGRGLNLDLEPVPSPSVPTDPRASRGTEAPTASPFLFLGPPGPSALRC